MTGEKCPEIEEEEEEEEEEDDEDEEDEEADEEEEEEDEEEADEEEEAAAGVQGVEVTFAQQTSWASACCIEIAEGSKCGDSTAPGWVGSVVDVERELPT